MSNRTLIVVSRRHLSLVSDLALTTESEPARVVTSALTLYVGLWKREKDGFNLVARIDGRLVDYFISRPKGRLHLIWRRLYDLRTRSNDAYMIKHEDVQTRLVPILNELRISLQELLYHALVTYQDAIELDDKSGGWIYLRKPSDGSEDLPGPSQNLLNKTRGLYLISDPLEPFVIFKK